jgi:recombination protein RecR
VVKKVEYPLPIKNLVNQLRRMPGIGPRSAERIALWMVQSKDARPQEIAEALQQVSDSVRPCRECGFFTTEELCPFCEDPSRASGILCVVELATDILPLERTGVFAGRYHALGGRISPLDGIGPEDLRIHSLLERIGKESPREIILALSSDVEGEATANYIAELLKGQSVAVSRIAQGLPAGGGLESADELTLSRALAGRRQIT